MAYRYVSWTNSIVLLCWWTVGDLYSVFIVDKSEIPCWKHNNNWCQLLVMLKQNHVCNKYHLTDELSWFRKYITLEVLNFWTILNLTIITSSSFPRRSYLEFLNWSLRLDPRLQCRNSVRNIIIYFSSNLRLSRRFNNRIDNLTVSCNIPENKRGIFNELGNKILFNSQAHDVPELAHHGFFSYYG